MTEATLGFKIDSTPAVSGAADLDKLTAAATRTTQAVDKLEAEAAGLGAALGKAGDDARKALPAVDGLGRSFGSQDDHVRAFRMEVERLTMKFRPLAQATQQYEATVGEIQRAHKLGAITAQEMTAALDRERQAFERLKTSATAAGSAVKAANSNRGGAQSFNSANAAFQFQDIAVTAAMGMNPLMIGLQQGTQLASVVGSMERPVSGLAAAFTSLLSPVSLITIGLTAGTAALIQYFTTAESGAESTTKLFEEQNDVIRRAAALWGDAVPQLKAYVDELDRADKITEGKEASEILAGRELDGLGEKLQGIGRQFSEAVRGLRGVDADPAFVRDFSQAFGDLRERLDDGTASVADYNRAQMALSEAVDQYGVKSVLSFRDAFDLITQSIRKSIEASREARLAWIAGIAGGTNVQDIVGGSTFTEGGRTFRSADFVPFNVPTPGRRPNIELSGDADPDRILNSDGRLTDIPVPGRRPNFFELEEQKEKVDDVTKAYRQAQDAKADFWLDMSFQERQAERSAIDRQVASTLNRYGFDENLNSPEANAIRGQLRREQNRELIGGFITDLRDGLLSSGGDIGKAAGLDPDVTTIAHIVTYGQSLGVGAYSGALLNPTPTLAARALMFKSGIRTLDLDHSPVYRDRRQDVALLDHLTDAFEKTAGNYGETGWARMAAAVLAGSNALSSAHAALVTAHGIGASSYNSLKKGTVPYTNLLVGVRRAYNASRLLGMAYRLPAVVFVQGEGNAAATSAATYQANLEELQANLDADIKAITGQGEDVKLIIDQLSSWTRSGVATSGVPIGQLEAAKANPTKIFLVGPKYALAYASDGMHMVANGYARHAEEVARAWRAIQAGAGYSPLRVSSAVRAGATITVATTGGSGNLVVDTTQVPAKANSGVELFQTGGTPVTISSVAVSGTNVIVTLSGDPGAATLQLGFGYTGTINANAGTANAPLTNIRDSSADASLYGGALQKWLCHDLVNVA